MLCAQTKKQNYSQQVTEAIIHSLQGEVPPIEAIARKLMLSVRQLQRKLPIDYIFY